MQAREDALFEARDVGLRDAEVIRDLLLCHFGVVVEAVAEDDDLSVARLK